MRKVFRGMYPAKHGEEIPVPSRGIRNTRCTEQNGKRGCDRNPQNHSGHEARRRLSIQSFDKQAGDEIRILRLAPGHHAHDKWKAPGGKSNAILALKCVAPPQISHSIVPTTPIHSRTEIFPMVVIRRYSRITIKMTSPPEIAFACGGGKGYRYPAYFAKPIDADATESGACTNVCQTNKNDINRPHRSGPYASRKKTYVPPAFGIAAPSSDHTNASSVARSAPASHAMSACGPPIARITRELTTNGPMPTISIMFSATASLSPRPRSRAPFSVLFPGVIGPPRIANALRSA